MELVKAFEKVNGVPVHYKLVDRRPGDVATCYANADKAWKELNWKTEKQLKTCVKIRGTGNRKSKWIRRIRKDVSGGSHLIFVIMEEKTGMETCFSIYY